MIDEEVTLKNIQVHPDLIREFNIMKADLERTTGYPIKGGNPVVSKIVAEILRKRREKLGENVKIEVQKVKGCKKNGVHFL